MKLEAENEYIEHKKSTAELDGSMESISAILNKHGRGTLYFGTLSDGTIIGQQCSEKTAQIISNRIFESVRPVIYPSIVICHDGTLDYVKVEFEGSSGPYSAFGRYYLRAADQDKAVTPEKLRELFTSFSPDNSAWEKTESGCGIDDIDEDLLRRYHARGTQSGRISFPFLGVKETLGYLGLLAKDGGLNNAGCALFSKTKPYVLKLAVYAGDDRVTFLDLTQERGNIYELIEGAMSYLKKNMRWRQEISGGERIEKPEIPLVALREIVTNSFAHARFNNNTTNEIDVHPSFIEIFNPGQFPEGFMPEDFAYRNVKSIQANPIIADVLFKGHDIEGYGGGFRRAFDSCKAEGVGFNYQKTKQGFSFFFMRGSAEAPVVSQERIPTLEELVLDELSLRDGRAGSEIATIIGKDVRAVQRALNSLLDKGKVRKQGSGRGTSWFVV